MGVASSVANDGHNENDAITRTGAASAANAVGARRHNENDVTMTIAGLRRYGDWRHVATGCTAQVLVILLRLGTHCPCSRAVFMGAGPHYPCSRPVDTAREHG